METPSDLTWEDVQAVCKLMGVMWRPVEEGITVWRKDSFLGTTFSDPAEALEFISADEHQLETKYANILRTKS